MPGPVTLVVEGTTDAAVARRLLVEAGLQTGSEYVKSGKHALDQGLRGFNEAARFSHWLVLRDLDQDAPCAPQLRQRLLPRPAAGMRLHLPVRAVEAWLLADAEAIGAFLAVASRRVPADPESISHPQRALVDLARTSGRRGVREALVPAPGTTASVGPGYAAYLINYAASRWRPAVAARRSDSLARLRKHLRALARYD